MLDSEVEAMPDLQYKELFMKKSEKRSYADKRLSKEHIVSKTTRDKSERSARVLIKDKNDDYSNTLRLHFTSEKSDRRIKAKSVGFRSHQC